MLIIYDKTTGEPLFNSGTNSFQPEGPDFAEELPNAIAFYGGKAEDYGWFRVHDVEDRELVNSILQCGSYDLAFNENGEATGIENIYYKPTIVIPDMIRAGEQALIRVKDEGETVVLYIDGIEYASGLVPIDWQVVFETPGTYLIEVDAGRHGKVSQEVVVK